MTIRNRIVAHVTIRAGDLVPHPLQFRLHPDAQRDTLAASLQEVGFARSLLGYRLPDGRIQLIDGHLRRSLDPDMEVTVELLDVTEDEARKLLLTIDPLAALAETDEEMAAELARMTATDQETLQALWDSLADQTSLDDLLKKDETPPPEVNEQYLILVACTDESHQLELLDRFQQEGLTCKALLS
jgi:ParB-like chromosome segregation protein Spo0J